MNKNNFDKDEIEKFNRIASRWWDVNGDFEPLHKINPLRLDFISKNTKLENKQTLDIGCGGGILSESMDNIGAFVTGIDMASDVIDIAKLHQKESGTNINYQNISTEELASTNQGFYDVITCMEMLEHVPSPNDIISSCSSLLKDNGYVFFSTINRNFKSFVFAIIGAEHIFKLLPVGTHQYSKFIKPSEIEEMARKSNLELVDTIGINYNPLTKKYYSSSDVDVNYIMCFRKIST
jgi:2-polyprenyl-6-hydroxyphenyl methylase/3-demethylubiquinone-9 3-methyltransferase